jgi:hypothetical protein
MCACLSCNPGCFPAKLQGCTVSPLNTVLPFAKKVPFPRSAVACLLPSRSHRCLNSYDPPQQHASLWSASSYSNTRRLASSISSARRRLASSPIHGQYVTLCCFQMFLPKGYCLMFFASLAYSQFMPPIRISLWVI